MTLIPTDEELLGQLRNGEENAFAVIYKRYATELRNFAAARIGLREDAEEIVQEVFVSLWVRRDNLTSRIDLRPYLFTSVKYMIIRYISHRKVKQKYAEHYRLFEAAYDSLEITDLDPETTRAFMDKALAQLPVRCQEALNMRLKENLSNSDIAARMNISKATVENYIVSGVKSLRESFRDFFAVR
ncbi:MAG TPA: RNA polymerase sigma-70 factor [Ohtaekwangia sp.]